METTKVMKALIRRVEKEPYARKLGMRLVKVDSGRAVVELDVTADTENIHGITHGGAIFSLIDEAFELSSNSHGTVALALNMNVTFHQIPRKGATLRAESREIHRTRKTATYDIRVTEDGDRTLIASSTALVYRKRDPLPFLDEM